MVLSRSVAVLSTSECIGSKRLDPSADGANDGKMLMLKVNRAESLKTSKQKQFSHQTKTNLSELAAESFEL